MKRKELTGYIIKYGKKMLSEGKKISKRSKKRLRHENASERNGYAIVRCDRMEECFKKYKGKIENTCRLVRWDNIGKEITVNE